MSFSQLETAEIRVFFLKKSLFSNMETKTAKTLVCVYKNFGFRNFQERYP